MFFQLQSYLKFLWKSKNEHGVHSPFVFDLVTKCFYDRRKYPEYKILKSYRSSLLKNKNFIKVADFGAGSKIFKSNKREISKIAQTAGITSRYAEVLFRLVNYFKPDAVLEIGTSLGIATSALSLGNKNATIITLEGCAETAKIAQQQFENFGFTNVHSVVTEFQTYLNNNPQPSTNNLLVYFDGNHTKQATLDYFTSLLSSVTNESVWIFDDIHWSSEMEEAWKLIQNHPSVSVTIDTFRWGIVFFRKEQQKEHFVIRI